MATQQELEDLKARLLAIISLINKVMRLGRPAGKSNVALDAEAILVNSLQNGLNVRQACLQASISHTAYYDEVARNLDFAYKMETAEQFGTMKARQNIVRAINNGDLATSKWHLERKDPEYKPKNDITSDNKPLKTALVEFVGEDGPGEQSQD